MIASGNDLFVIGGISPSCPVFEKSIYKLTCSSGLCKWTTLSQKLQMGRNSFVAFPLTDSSVSCTPRHPNLPPPKGPITRCVETEYGVSFKTTGDSGNPWLKQCFNHQCPGKIPRKFKKEITE